MFISRTPPYTLFTRRMLRTFPHPRPEIVIANNSGIFFTLAAIREHGRHMHPHLTIIKPDFWLDKIHPDYEKLDWGQTPRGLPWFVREEFFTIYSGHGQQEYIRWGQFKELRNHVLDELKKLNVPTYTGIPTIEKRPVGYKVTTNEVTFHTEESTYFYNSFREPDTKHGLNNLPHVSHTSLYTSPSTNTPKTCVLLGGGRSAYWAASHHPQTLFACISDKPSLPLFKDESQPNNILLFSSSDFSGPHPKYLIVKSPGDDKKALILENNETLNPLFEGEFFCSIGLVQRQDVTEQVSAENLSLYPLKTRLGDWIAPEEIPIGSLMESTVRWAIKTDNLSWAYETYCYYPDYFIDQVIMRMEEKGIQFPHVFFDHLRTSIIERSHALTQEEVISIYKDSFVKAYKGNVSEDMLNTFEKTLREIEQTRIAEYKDKTIMAIEDVNPKLTR